MECIPPKSRSWSHVGIMYLVSVTNVLKHLQTRQYRCSHQNWRNIYHIEFYSCNLCGWSHSGKLWVEHIHHGMTWWNLMWKWTNRLSPPFSCGSGGHRSLTKRESMCSLWIHLDDPLWPSSQDTEGWHGFTNNTDNPPASWWGQWAETIYSIEMSI